MSAHHRGRFTAVALLSPIVFMLVACGGSSGGGTKTDAGGTAVCPSEATGTASTGIPSDIPAPQGASAPYDYFPQGATKVWNFALDGTANDLVKLRDAYDKALQAKGYEIEGTDQEPGHEAESEFKGAHQGTTNFRVLCAGKVVFRLKLTS
jgi:hypothetical protein